MSSSNSSSTAVLTFTYVSPQAACAIMEATEPDNVQAPPGIEIDAAVEGSTLTVKVTCSRGVGSLVATLDDLVSCIQAAEQALIGVNLG